MTARSTKRTTSTTGGKGRKYTEEGNPSLMKEPRCKACAHLVTSHGNLGCLGLDAAGDTCDCDLTFQGVVMQHPPFVTSPITRWGDLSDAASIRQEAPSSKHVAWIDAVIEDEPNDEGFSAQEYAQRRGIVLHVADMRLRRLAEKGVLIAGWNRSPNGRRIRVYRPKES